MIIVVGWNFGGWLAWVRTHQIYHEGELTQPSVKAAALDRWSSWGRSRYVGKVHGQMDYAKRMQVELDSGGSASAKEELRKVS